MTFYTTFRHATAGDDGAVGRLAALDSARRLSGHVLLAEVDGRPVAALSVDDGEAVADPFAPTAHVVQMLRLQAAQLRLAA